MSTKTIDEVLKGMDIETKTATFTGERPIRMQDTVWNDLVIPIHSQGNNNPNPPVWRKRVDSGATPTRNVLAIQNGSNEDTAAYFAKNTDNDLSGMTNWTVAFWFTPQSRGSGIFDLAGVLSLDVDYSDRLRFQYGNNGYKYLLNSVVYGQRYCVVIAADPAGSYTRVRVWINNNEKLNEQDSAPSSSWSSNWILGARGSNTSPWWYGDVELDEFRIWNRTFNSTDRTDFYNSGAGTSASIGSDEKAWYNMDETSGSTSFIDDAGSNDGAFWGTHYDFISGGVGGENAEGGLYSPVFEAGDNQQVEFAQQVTHEFGVGENFIGRLHMHVQIRQHDDPTKGYDPSFSTVLPVLKCEYTLNNVFEDESNTQTQDSVAIHFTEDGGTSTAHSPKRHAVVMWYVEGTGGTSMTKTTANNDVSYSAMFSGRIYRDKDDGSPYDIYMLQADAHLAVYEAGTANEWHN